MNRQGNPLIALLEYPVMGLLAFPALFFAFLPYITPVPTSSDIQPIALVLSLAFIGAYIIQPRSFLILPITPVIKVLFGVTLYSVFVSLFHGYFDLRDTVGYASVAILATSGYIIITEDFIRAAWIKLFIGIWFAVGLIQRVVNPDFLIQFLPRASTSEGRGVVALAPEPTFYGIACVLMFIIVEMLGVSGKMSKKGATFCRWLLFAQILILAKSSMVILMLVIYFFLRTLVYGRVKYLILSIVPIVAGYYYISLYQPDSRMADLLKLLVEHPETIYLFDGSINDRLSHLVISLEGFYRSLPFAFGRGSEAWEQYMGDALYRYPGFVWAVVAPRIMSGFGSALFELGYVGLLFPVLVLYSFWKHGHKDMKILGLFLCIIMFSAIPLAFPLFGLAIGFSEGLRSHRGRQVVGSVEKSVSCPAPTA